MPTNSFHIVCESASCDVDCTTDDIEVASTFAEKHKKHTGHELTWKEADFSTPFSVDKEWRVECEVCDDSWGFSLITEVGDFKQEHAAYTDHEIEIEAGQEAIEADPNPDEEVEITTDLEIDTLNEYIYLVGEQFGSGLTAGIPVELIYDNVTSKADIDPETVRQKLVELENKERISVSHGTIGLKNTLQNMHSSTLGVEPPSSELEVNGVDDNQTDTTSDGGENIDVEENGPPGRCDHCGNKDDFKLLEEVKMWHCEDCGATIPVERDVDSDDDVQLPSDAVDG